MSRERVAKAGGLIEREAEFLGDTADMERWRKAKETFAKLQDGLAELDALGLRYELKARGGMKTKRKRETLRLTNECDPKKHR